MLLSNGGIILLRSSNWRWTMSPKEKLLVKHVMAQVALEFSRGPGEEPLDISGFSIPPPAPKLPEVITLVDKTKLKPKTDADMLADLAAIEEKSRRRAQEKISAGERFVLKEKEPDLRAEIITWANNQGMSIRTAQSHSPQIAKDLRKIGWKSLTEAQVRQMISTMIHQR
ncbi:MAG: hypothetical protein NUW02_01695 [Candidatus Campbellbacteria bacterium]|nr:hypothetical protein [Candidatus Campbellbacteria bacterium]